jgi:DNA polymerase III sliding clamp (beta) subunit (PCNA family)
MVLSTVDNHTLFATFKASVLAQSVKRTLLVAEGKAAAISMEFKDGKLRMEAKTADSGEVSEVMDTNFNGEAPVKVWINGRFLQDFLESLGSGNARIEVADNLSPVHALGMKENVTYRNIIMTLNVPE